MAKEEMIEMEGTVHEVLPNTQFRVRLVNGAEVLAYAGGKMRQRRIRIIAGDRVNLEMSPTMSRAGGSTIVIWTNRFHRGRCAANSHSASVSVVDYAPQ